MIENLIEKGFNSLEISDMLQKDKIEIDLELCKIYYKKLRKNVSFSLNDLLNIVNRIVSPRGTLPVLNNILIKTDKGQLKFAATDLEIGINTWIGAKIDEEGAITIPSRLMSDFVNTNNDETINLEQKDTTLFLKSAKYQANIKGIITGLNRTIKNFEIISATLGESTPEIESALENLKNLTAKLDNAAEPLGTTIGNLSKITDSLAAADLSATIGSLKMLLDDMRNPAGSLGKLMTTDSLHTSVNTLVKNLDELIENINKNPKKYIKITVF